MTEESYRLGSYRIGTNIPFRQGAVWDNVARASRWGAGTIELNTSAETLGRNALQVIKEQAKVNNLVYTWHVPPAPEQAGELSVPNDQKSNAFARDVLAQAIEAASQVGARHITFHPTLQAARPDPDKMWIYDPREGNVKPAKLIRGLNKEESLKVLNEGAKAQLFTQLNSIESQYNMVNSMDKIAEKIKEMGKADIKTADMMRYLAIESSRYGAMVGLHPEDPSIWARIQEKALRKQELNDDEQKTLKDFAEKVRGNVDAYKQYFKSQIDTLKPWAGKDVDLVKDGEREMLENVAKNVSEIPMSVLNKAVRNDISLGFENLPGNTLFSTPGEMNQLRDLTVKKLIEKGMNEDNAKKLIGFTFDFAHANITKNMNIAGADFTTIPEFIEKLGGNIKHIHAVDNVGLVDAHLPMGQGEVGGDKVTWDKIMATLKKIDFKGTSVFELGNAELPITYAVSHEFMEPGFYTVAGAPGTPGMRTTSLWGPSYVEAAMTDPLMLQKDQGYFYESFVDIF